MTKSTWLAISLTAVAWCLGFLPPLVHMRFRLKAQDSLILQLADNTHGMMWASSNMMMLIHAQGVAIVRLTDENNKSVEIDAKTLEIFRGVVGKLEVLENRIQTLEQPSLNHGWFVGPMPLGTNYIVTNYMLNVDCAVGVEVTK